MLKKTRELFENDILAAPLSAMNVDNARLAVATVLLCAASADGVVTVEEEAKIKDALRLCIPAHPEDADALFSKASQHALESALAEINKLFTESQRVEILGLVWGVLGADLIATHDETRFAVYLRAKLGLSLEQGLQARKLAEGTALDGFKEFVEAARALR
jgi:uncharacterized tellurite resistance protein B-like protein